MVPSHCAGSKIFVVTELCAIIMDRAIKQIMRPNINEMGMFLRTLKCEPIQSFNSKEIFLETFIAFIHNFHSTEHIMFYPLLLLSKPSTK